MFDPKTYTFDMDKLTELFRQNDFTRQLSGMKMPGFDADAVMAAQQKNMNALVEAHKAAAAGSQDLFKKQMKAFDATKLDADTAKAQAELAKAAFEKALANMQALAEAAQKANAEAYEIVSARIKESIGELKELAGKAGRG